MPDQVKTVAFLIENQFNKNDDVKKEIETKLATENSELRQELSTLKEEGTLTVKSLKEAGNALAKVEAQEQALKDEL